MSSSPGLLTGGHYALRRKGLKWDPVSIADKLVLLRGSDILNDFAGLDTMNRKMINILGRGRCKWYYRRFQQNLAEILPASEGRTSLQGRTYRLGYWSKGGEIWYGIRKGPNYSGMRRYSTNYLDQIRLYVVRAQDHRSGQHQVPNSLCRWNVPQGHNYRINYLRLLNRHRTYPYFLFWKTHCKRLVDTSYPSLVSICRKICFPRMLDQFLWFFQLVLVGYRHILPRYTTFRRYA